MITTLNLTICLLASHFIGDFLFSVKLDGTSKSRILIIVKHAAMVAGLSYVLCGAWTLFEIPLFVLVAHTAVDLIKEASGGKNLSGFLWDQIAHLTLTILIAIGVTLKNPASLYGLYWIEQFHASYLRMLILTAGGIITVRAGNVLVAAVVQPFLAQIEEDLSKEEWDYGKSPTGGLKGAGSLIGQLERALIFLFIMIDQPAAIGFLITAKSILRFGEIKDSHHRRLTEYIIIGTMMSFAYGVFASYLTKLLMNLII